MKTYQTYSTSIKIYYSLGLQEQFVAEDIRSKIPSSTASSWKNYPFSTIIGSDLETNVQKNLSEIQLLYHSYGTIPRKIATAQIRLMMLLVSCFSKPVFQKAIRKSRVEIINLLDRFEKQISYKQLGKVLQVSTKTLYHWRTQVKFKCDHSPISLCVKRNSNQATISEVNSIQKWLLLPEYSHWGIHSIWAKVFKEHQTSLSLKSWYHYNQLLKIRLYSKKGPKPKRIPLRANSVNQIWHADITVFKTLDGTKHYIYTVLDNYSRFIHSWHIDTVVSATIRLKTIRDALTSAFGKESYDQLQLVTDGGPENDNLTIKEFIQTSNINHTIALRDIKQSNSMMEAFYRTSKYNYLYLKQILNGTQLKLEFQNWIQEYNFEKPHYALGIYSPSEVLNGADLSISHRASFLEAAIKRREINKNFNCPLKCD
jgi:putative transposase